MKKLILCDTLYQIIVGIQLSLTLFQEDSVDFWISDHSIGAEEIARRLSREPFVHDATYIRTKTLVYARSRGKKLWNAMVYGVGLKTIDKDMPLYDEIVYYSLSSVVCSIQAHYERKGFQTRWSRFEEGIFSYETDASFGNSVALINRCRSALGKTSLPESVKTYYCFFPELKDPSAYTLVRIPTLEENLDAVREILCRVFAYRPEPIAQKYIVFASSSDIDGHPFGESETIRKVIACVGSENVIIKLHPRDDRDVFRKLGAASMELSGVPWEVMHICGDFREKVLVSVISGSFINTTAMCGYEGRAYMLYPAIESHSEYFGCVSSNVDQILAKMHGLGIGKNIVKTQNINDLR